MAYSFSIWNGLKVACLIIGTTIGAGFASGREIWEFFTSYGEKSSWYILLSLVLFTLSCYLIMKVSHDLQASHYFYVLEEFLGKKIAKVYDIFILVYLFSTTVIMFAGSGATLTYYSIPYWMGVLILAVAVWLVFFGEQTRIVALNSILIPFLIVTLLAICLLFLRQQEGQVLSGQADNLILSSALAFIALNIMPLFAVLSALGSRMNKLEISVASISSGVILALITVLYNEALLQLGNQIMLYEIPLYALLQYFPGKMMVIISLVLWLAIYTTAISGMFGLVSRLQGIGNLPAWLLALLLIILVLPFTVFGFAKLIQILYPLYGMLNLFMLSMILLYPIIKLK